VDDKKVAPIEAVHSQRPHGAMSRDFHAINTSGKPTLNGARCSCGGLVDEGSICNKCHFDHELRVFHC